MRPRATLLMQARTLGDEVRRERERLERHIQAAEANPGSSPVPAEVFHRLRTELAIRQQKLQQVMDSLAADGELSAERTAYRRLDRQCHDLFGECLAVFTEEAMRSLRLDDGACEIVEKFLKGLGRRIGIPWPHVATLSEAEFFGTASQVIRIRYPVTSVWDYPVAAHEFGHFAGPRWPSTGDGDPTGYQTFLDVQKCGPRSHLTEYFADMFATFVLGPAYVNTCFFRRFDPVAKGDDDHPGDGVRAEWILMALEFLQESAEKEKPGSASSKYLKRLVAERRADWADAVAENGGKSPDRDLIGQLTIRSRTLWKSLMEWASEVAYRDLGGAMVLKADFLDRPGQQKVPAGVTISDIVNAAWMLRMDNEIDKNKIEGWAQQLCMKALA